EAAGRQHAAAVRVGPVAAPGVGTHDGGAIGQVPGRGPIFLTRKQPCHLHGGGGTCREVILRSERAVRVQVESGLGDVEGLRGTLQDGGGRRGRVFVEGELVGCRRRYRVRGQDRVADRGREDAVRGSQSARDGCGRG